MVAANVYQPLNSPADATRATPGKPQIVKPHRADVRPPVASFWCTTFSDCYRCLQASFVTSVQIRAQMRIARDALWLGRSAGSPAVLAIRFAERDAELIQQLLLASGIGEGCLN